jgi:hypothetical protein
MVRRKKVEEALSPVEVVRRAKVEVTMSLVEMVRRAEFEETCHWLKWLGEQRLRRPAIG